MIALLCAVWLCSGMLARPLISRVIDQMARVVENVDRGDRDGADMELYKICAALECFEWYMWCILGPLLLPVGLWGVFILSYGKLRDAYEGMSPEKSGPSSD